MINRLKNDKKILERQAKNKAMKDEGLDFIMKKMEESMPDVYGHLGKYTDIDKDILQLENIKKNLLMKGRKPNASGGIAGPLHLNQGGRARFQDGALAAYQSGQNIIGAPVETQTAQEEISWEPGQAAPEGYEVKRALGDEWIERVEPSMPPMPPLGPIPPWEMMTETGEAASGPGTAYNQPITPEMQQMQARGIDPRMARSYQENIQLMGDPRMHPPMGGMPIGVVPPPPSDGWFASNEGLSGQEYAEKHGIPYARGGRASYTKGGLAKILGV